LNQPSAGSKVLLMKRLGYLVPEFPGQTHIFFWRELQCLTNLGVEYDLVSTRRPLQQIISHSWSQEAMARTTYLSPLNISTILAAIWEILRSGPKGWRRCFSEIIHADVPTIKMKFRLVGLMFFGAELAALARRRKWGEVHVHSCADSAHVAMFAQLLSRVPYSLTLHGPLIDYGPNQAAKWKHADFAIVITQQLLKEVGAELGWAVPRNIEVAPMGVDIATFARQLPYRSWDGTGPFQIFSCGRLNPCKGHDDLIRAVDLLRKNGIDARLTIAGADDSAGKYQPVLENLIGELKLNEAVTLLGAVSEELVRKGLEESHVFALASLREPLGVAIMEAMAMEMPVVVTGAGGVPELVDDGSDGILVQPRNPGELAAALERVARDRELATRLAAAARRKIETSFQSDQSARVLCRYLQSLG
jgi:colanic acid/amylovoran biosynthesis glycosyltransferase